MNEFVAYISRLIGQVIFWVTVAPWEQAILVRAGKHVYRLKPGFHLRIPIFDVVLKQSIRLRTCLLPTQTLSTSDGHTLIVGACIGYEIFDVEMLYRTLHHAEDTIVQLSAMAMAKHISETARADLTADSLGRSAFAEIADAFKGYGIASSSLRVTDFAFVRAFRLVQDYRMAHGEALTTKPEAAS